MKFFKDNKEEKDPPICSPEWPWSLPRSVMLARYGKPVPWDRYEPPHQGDCNPVPINLAECERLGTKPRKDLIDTLAKMWETYCHRNKIREPGEEG